LRNQRTKDKGAKMTRKDYILLAEVLRVQYRRALNTIAACAEDKTLCLFTAEKNAQVILELAEEMADSLHHDNARFRKDHFLAVVRGQKELNSKPSRNQEAQ
jgi:hypothetical protein